MAVLILLSLTLKVGLLEQKISAPLNYALFVLYNVMQLASTLLNLSQLHFAPLASTLLNCFEANTSTPLHFAPLASTSLNL